MKLLLLLIKFKHRQWETSHWFLVFYFYYKWLHDDKNGWNKFALKITFWCTTVKFNNVHSCVQPTKSTSIQQAHRLSNSAFKKLSQYVYQEKQTQNEQQRLRLKVRAGHFLRCVVVDRQRSSSSGFCCGGPGCLLMMVHCVSDAVISQWMEEEDCSCSTHMLSSFFNTYGAVNTKDTDD